jgi:hypothetical protein
MNIHTATATRREKPRIPPTAAPAIVAVDGPEEDEDEEEEIDGDDEGEAVREAPPSSPGLLPVVDAVAETSEVGLELDPAVSVPLVTVLTNPPFLPTTATVDATPRSNNKLDVPQHAFPLLSSL